MSYSFSVTLNYQTEDIQNLYNTAKFSENGGCGYLLKPEFLRDPSTGYSPIGPCGLDPICYPTWKINIKVISGHNIPKRESGESSNAYVKLRIRGHETDESELNIGLE